MSFNHSNDLPSCVRDHLPPMRSRWFNNAYAAHEANQGQGEATYRIAWAAAKRHYKTSKSNGFSALTV